MIGHMIGIRSIQKKKKKKKRKGRKRIFLGPGTTNRLTVPSQHRRPTTPHTRPKKCVPTPRDPWGASQLPGSSQPAYGVPTMANRWFLLFALRTGEVSVYYRIVPCANWAPGPRQGGRKSRGLCSQNFSK